MNKFLTVIYSRTQDILKIIKVSSATYYQRILKWICEIFICKWEKFYKLKCCIVSVIPSFTPTE